jgi:hypothetical protein
MRPVGHASLLVVWADVEKFIVINQPNPDLLKPAVFAQ